MVKLDLTFDLHKVKCKHHVQSVCTICCFLVQKLESGAQSRCDCLVDSLDKHSTAFDGDIGTEKSTVATQEEQTSKLSQELTAQLESHAEDMEKHIRNEISEDKPTGVCALVDVVCLRIQICLPVSYTTCWDLYL